MRYPLNGPKPGMCNETLSERSTWTNMYSILDLEDSELVRERQLDIEQALQEMDDEDMF